MIETVFPVDPRVLGVAQQARDGPDYPSISNGAGIANGMMVEDYWQCASLGLVIH